MVLSHGTVFSFLALICLFFCAFTFLQPQFPPIDFRLHWCRHCVGLEHLSIQPTYVPPWHIHIVPCFPKGRSPHPSFAVNEQITPILKTMEDNKCSLGFSCSFSLPIVKSQALILALKVAFDPSLYIFIQKFKKDVWSTYCSRQCSIFSPLLAKSSAVQTSHLHSQYSSSSLHHRLNTFLSRCFPKLFLLPKIPPHSVSTQ